MTREDALHALAVSIHGSLSAACCAIEGYLDGTFSKKQLRGYLCNYQEGLKYYRGLLSPNDEQLINDCRPEQVEIRNKAILARNKGV